MNEHFRNLTLKKCLTHKSDIKRPLEYRQITVEQVEKFEVTTRNFAKLRGKSMKALIWQETGETP